MSKTDAEESKIQPVTENGTKPNKVPYHYILFSTMYFCYCRLSPKKNVTLSLMVVACGSFV